MLKEMIIKSGVVVAGMLVTQVILEKLERDYLKQDNKTKCEGQTVTVEVDNEHCTGTETYYSRWEV